MKTTVAVILEADIKKKLLYLAASKDIKLAELLRDILTKSVAKVVIPEPKAFVAANSFTNEDGVPWGDSDFTKKTPVRKVGRPRESTRRLPPPEPEREVLPKDFRYDIDPKALMPNEKSKWFNEFKD